MTVVTVHVHHFTNIPDFQTSIVGDSVELFIILVELYACDGVPVTHERLDLLLIVDVPNSDYAVFAATDEELSVSRHGAGHNFVEVASYSAVELLALEERFAL